MMLILFTEMKMFMRVKNGPSHDGLLLEYGSQ